MEGRTLAATHISSIFPPSLANSSPIPTSRRNLPLPPAPKESDPPTEHASYSTVFHHKSVGSILLRVVHAGIVLELISISDDVRPLRFIFPAPILPAPSIFVWEQSELHVVAVTTSGSLYRVVLRLDAGSGRVWSEQLGKNWCREYVINYGSGALDGLVQVQGTHCVAVGLRNGSLLRLETDMLGDDFNNDEWTETILQHTSIFNQLASLLQTSLPGGSETVSMASFPQPTDIGHIWTLARDRTLRLWTAKLGCVSALTLPLDAQSRTVAVRASPGAGSSPGPSSRTLLDATPQPLLRVFLWNDIIHVLCFVPALSSASSAGIFHILACANDALHHVQSIECSPASSYCQLRDMIVMNDIIYVLWDRQGQTLIESIMLYPDAAWCSSTYPSEPGLTPAYLDELLLAPGSLAAKFFQAIMRPGVFSTLTLRTAIEQYTDACLSVATAGPPPLQLRTTYATLGEQISAVVGCTVKVARDPQTGALLHDSYWSALKRDWEGFVARCREIERSARWPLALGMAEVADKTHVVVVERERLAVLVDEDQPLTLHRYLGLSLPVGHSPSHVLFEVLWTLRVKLGPRAMRMIEGRVVDTVHQEIAFPFADIIRDLSARIGFKEALLDEGVESWISGRLQSIGGVEEVQDVVRVALDVVAGFEKQVKREEDEVALLLPITGSEWTRALTAAYVSCTVRARYELCLALVLLLFFVADDLDLWEHSLLAEIFAIFRGIVMLEYVIRQPGGDMDGGSGMAVEDSGGPDEVVARMRGMQVSQSSATRSAPAYSLVHRLLSQTNSAGSPATSAHQFLDGLGLMEATSPAHVTKSEVLFCERLRLLGCLHVAREMLGRLPRTPGVTYVLARLWLDVGRSDDAVSLLQNLAGTFGQPHAVPFEDKDALAAVLPGAQLFDSDFSFYLDCAALFKAASEMEQEVVFSQLALSVAPPEIDTAALSLNVIKGLIELTLYEDAYFAIVTSPYEKMKRECISKLVYRMCEENAVDKLMNFNFAGLADEVEEALAFKARNADPRRRPFYSRILYSWYVSRGDYRNAALAMYQRARKLSQLSVAPSEFPALFELQSEAYAVAINALSLLEQPDAWIVLPSTGDSGSEHARKRRKLCRYIPIDKITCGKRDAELIELNDMRYEFSLAQARLETIRKDPSLLASNGSLLSPELLVLTLVQTNHFNTAMATARSLNVPMTDLFSRLTSQCMRLNQNATSVTQEDTSDWLLTDHVSSWRGSPADRGWRYLRLALERHDNVDTDYSYSKAAYETLLSHDLHSPPPWLIKSLESHDPEYLIRTCLRYEDLMSALEFSIALVQRANTALSRDPPKHSMATRLPYTLIDQVLAATEPANAPGSQTRSLHDKLKKDVENRLARLTKLSLFEGR